MSDNIKNLEAAIAGILADERTPTPEMIRKWINDLRKIPSCAVDDDTAEKLACDLEMRHGVTMRIGSILVENEFRPWLDSAKKSQIDPFYWDRYRKLLAQQGFSSQVIATLDDVTDRTLGLLGDPRKEGQWDRRGLVVGHVQSGKTANYIGLISKAADAGYKLIVVIAGIHNNLRNQTQVRIDQGFVGRDSARMLSKKSDRFLGVGRIDSSRRPVTFTNSIKDFNRGIATAFGMAIQDLMEPAVFVIKKNTNTLKNLYEWLNEHSASRGATSINVPMLLIDDEADNASINIRHGKDEVSRINGQIRSLLKIFDRSCYVGYTATPFANIFIDPDSDDEMVGEDLFPRSFIISLDPPTNYFGATRVFLDVPDQIIRHIEDNEDLLPLKHKIDFTITALPQSLINAIRTFVVARAIRLARGHKTAHCSMLVNASRFTGIQGQLKNAIHIKMTDIKSSIKINSKLKSEISLRDPEMMALFNVWKEEYSDTGFEWPVIQKFLFEASAPVKVVEVNSASPGTLNYNDYEETGLNIIAVGGFSLSRGLTLEGLMVSYFLRNSMMYDTLMQMGRWFGYRPGYDDLCRIWMPEEAEGWYSHISESIEMLRDELRSMEAASATPEEFGLKVRSSPDTLIVTARNKMGSAEKVVVRVGLANSFIETAILKRDTKTLDENREAVVRLGKRLYEAGLSGSELTMLSGGYLIRKGSVQIIMDFISEFKNHIGSILTDPGPVKRYIEDRKDGELAEWDILFTSKNRGKDILTWNLPGFEIRCTERTAGRKSDASTLRITNKQRVASRGIEKTGLTDEMISNAESEYKTEKGIIGEAANYPDWIYRKKRKYPLLIIHLLKIHPEDRGPEYNKPVAAWGISFPKTSMEEKRVEYVVNTTWMRENYRLDIDEEEMGGEDE